MDLLEKNASHDDEIIDLTDIIEQGSIAPSAKPNAEPTIDAQMDTLFTKGNKEDQHLVPDTMDDIDSLLAEMSDNLSAAQAPAPPVKAASAAPQLNPDETLDMPNMSEVDALLQSLDIPPQPADTSTASAPDNLPNNLTDDLPNDLGDDIDSLLNGLLDGSAKAAPAPAQAPAMDMDDLDALLASAPAKPAAPAEAKAAPAPAEAPAMDMDDLDALLASAPAKPAAPAEAKAAPAPAEAPAMDMDDLDALLASAPAKPAAPAEAKAAPAPAQAPAMDMDDLDALLASAPAKPAAPAEAKAAPASAKTNAPTLEDDLDALLGPNLTDSTEIPSFDDELEALLAAAADPSPVAKSGQRNAPEPATADSTAKDTSAVADFLSLEDDLDALFNTVSPAAGPQTDPVLDSEPLSADTDSALPTDNDDDIPIDLSDLDDTDISLAEAAAQLAATVAPAKDHQPHASAEQDILAGIEVDPAPTSDEDLTQQAFEEIASLMADATGAQKVSAPAPAVDIAMVSMTDMTDMPDMPKSSPENEEDLPELDALDALLQAASTVEPRTELPELATDMDLATDTNLAQEDDDITFSDEEIARAVQELYDEKVMAEATTGDVDTDAWLNNLDEVIDDTDDSCDAPSDSAAAPENIDQLLAHLPEDPENSHYIYRPSAVDTTIDSAKQPDRQANDQAPTADSPHFEKTYGQELARLQHITDRFAQSLAAADMHIAALTNTTASAVPPIRGMDDILRADSPFTTTLQSLIRNAVASELRPTAANPVTLPAVTATEESDYTAANTPVTTGISDLGQRLDALSTQMQSLLERVTALEDGNKEARLQTVETRVDGQGKTIIHLEEHCKILEAHLEAQAKSQANFENRFQHEVERAAAAAAAKVIREEIAGILAGQ